MRVKLLTQKEVAEWIGISVRTLQDWRVAGREPDDPIPFVRVARYVRYREDQVQEWLDRNSGVEPRRRA